MLSLSLLESPPPPPRESQSAAGALGGHSGVRAADANDSLPPGPLLAGCAAVPSSRFSKGVFGGLSMSELNTKAASSGAVRNEAVAARDAPAHSP
jgi:hypothetical protein